MTISDVPSLTQFDPRAVPYQHAVLKDIRENFDYSNGAHEVLLSGSVGSAKSLLMAHVAVTHCLENAGARFLLARRSMPDLKDTIYRTVLDHMEEDMVEGEDYETNSQKASITFANGSEIISRSWADKKFKRFRSLKISGAAIEELTENGDEDKQFYTELYARVGRLPHVKENILISATNPDAPSHWAYKHFISEPTSTRHVYYSVTTDNPFLPKWYVDSLLANLDEKMAQRLVYGKWIEIASEVVYYSYSRENNFRDREYDVDPRLPIHLCFDFNIGLGKPMSACAFQYDGKNFHFFTQWIVEGASTEDLMEEIGESGVLEHPARFIVNGDASGKNRDTRSKRSDYDIIQKYLANHRTKDGRPLVFEQSVPPANPPVRKRHNTMNGLMRNSLGASHLFVYAGAKTVDEGFRLTKLLKGASYAEDDSKPYQHVTTAAGYGVMSTLTAEQRKSSSREN